MTLLLVPSPLLGPSSWARVATHLRRLGHEVVVADTGAPQRPEQVVDAVVEAADGRTDLVLVPHSNAGLYVPHLDTLLDVTARVYVDAALAGTGPSTALAPDRLRTMLAGFADDDDLLPPWTRWWDDLDGVFPDAATQAEIERGQPRLPLSYFDARLPVPAGWADRPSAYLAFGSTYAEEVAFARSQGWPVAVMDGSHLHALHDPEGVADEILRLAGRVTA